MDADTQTRIEVETLHEILEGLNHYQLLCVDPACPQNMIEASFREESKRLHPDRMSTFPDEEVRQQAKEIYKAINEAYRTLKDPDLRMQYDQEILDGTKTLGDQKGSSGGDANPETAASHPKAEKYWTLALQDYADGNWKGCQMNIQFALSFEPDNDTFHAWMAKAKDAEADEGKEKNPYKLRLM